MISYYFDSNDADTEKAFDDARIPLKGAVASYVDQIKNYLAVEYNTPFKDFIEKTTCSDIVDAQSLYSAEEFVDDVMRNAPSGINAVLFY